MILAMLAPAVALGAYLMGSISFGLVIARQRGVDLRSIGSGNIGATNVGRALGKRTGRVVMLLDMLKGFVPVALAHWVFRLDGQWIAITGVAAALGHVLPVWHGFRGGKGAATAGGVLLAAIPWVGAATLVAFVVAKKISRRASVGSLSGATVGVLATALMRGPAWTVGLAVGLWVIVVVRHKDNIVRLAKGEEPAG